MTWEKDQDEAKRRSTIKRRIQHAVFAGTISVATISAMGAGMLAFSRRTGPAQFVTAFVTMPAAIMGSFYAGNATEEWLFDRYGVTWRD